MSRLAPPGGFNPPQAFRLDDGTQIDLTPLARKLCEHYYALYPDDLERYGPEGQAWCDHDSRYLLAWGLQDAHAHTLDCVAQVQWLARVLTARSFPIQRLARHVELAAEILRTSQLGNLGNRAGERMSEASRSFTGPTSPSSTAQPTPASTVAASVPASSEE
jgi:hypothetical protein